MLFSNQSFSHPHVTPCDVYPGTGFGYKDAPENQTEWIPDRQFAPRMSRQTESSGHGSVMALHPWYKLRGRMIEWMYHYNTIPYNNSWVYRWYDRSVPESHADKQMDLSQIDHMLQKSKNSHKNIKAK